MLQSSSTTHQDLTIRIQLKNYGPSAARNVLQACVRLGQAILAPYSQGHCQMIAEMVGMRIVSQQCSSDRLDTQEALADLLGKCSAHHRAWNEDTLSPLQYIYAHK